MRLSLQILCRLAPVVLSIFLLASPSRASTIIPPRDLGELARLSEAVVLARAGSAQPFARGHSLFTLTNFEVLHAVSGSLVTGETVSVASLGGEKGGVRAVVAGAPSFEEGKTYLLFLNQDQRGLWHPRLMAYGLLEQAQSMDGKPLLKPLPEAAGLGIARRLDGVQPEQIGTYRQEALLDHLGAVAEAELTWNARQVLAPAAALFDEALPQISFSKNAQGAPTECSFLGPNDGMLPFRWDLFEKGGSVEVYAQKGGDKDASEEETHERINAAMQAWQNIEGTSVTWELAGEKELPEGECDDGSAFPYSGTGEPNLIVFNDPCGERELGSGIIAWTYAYPAGSHSYNEESWYSIGSFRVIVAKGAADMLSPDDYRRMLTHELGHGLGFDHVTDETANMNGFRFNEINEETDVPCALYTYGASEQQTTPTAELPVELAGFDVRLDQNAARLTWQTVSETNNSGFEVQHAVEDGPFSEAGFVAGHGTTTEARDYAFSVERLEPGRHRFRLKQVDLDGAVAYSPEVEVAVGVPEAFALSDVYPNPFNPRAQFTLAVAAAQHVRVEVFDVRGRQVALLHDGFLEADRTHRFTLEAGSLPSGVYFYRATGETFHAAKPATLLK